METKYTNVDGLVYKEDVYETFTNNALVGPVEKVSTVRIDSKTVTNITYLFDFTAGDYTEKSRTNRDELEVIEKTEIDLLKEANADLKVRLADIEVAFAKLMGQEEYTEVANVEKV